MSSFTAWNDFEIYTVNQYTDKDLLHELIRLAQSSTQFSIDTESDFYTNRPALIQIEIIHPTLSTVLLVEVQHLPGDKQSLQFWLIRSMFKFVIEHSKTIFGWGKLEKELQQFVEFGLFTVHDLTRPDFIDMQEEFHRWHYQQYHFLAKGKNLWGLQAAIEDQFKEYLDKSQRLNRWSRGLYYRRGGDDELNKKIRAMIDYASNDCLAVTKLAYRTGHLLL